MPENEKIDANQLMFLLVPTVISTAILIVPNVVAMYTRQDGWISIIAAWFLVLASTLSIAAVCSHYPGSTLIQITGNLIGKWFEKTMCILYIYFFVLYITVPTNEIVDFTALYALARTPPTITMVLFLTLTGLAAWAGVEVIARAAGFMLPMAQIFVVIATVLLMRDFHFDLLKPALSTPAPELLRGSLIPMAWLSETFILGFLTPWLRELKPVVRITWWTMAMLGSTMVLVFLDTFLVLGPLTGHVTYSFYTAIRQVSIANFIERIDPVVVSVWVYGVFIKVSLFLWLLCTAVQRLFALANYRPLVLPTTLFCMVATMWTFRDAASMDQFLTYTIPMSSILFQMLLPFMIYIVHLYKRSRRQ
ncbi:endospore germination permease [Alicyclobacillus sp.]|uniref:GerAB/ArcD/ProY family transporter n=1 Tax=Alicyclobacillus sp. TaxID=61169 RepID=UPI0025BF03A8|nr:endospore germination permease [Alicyclobacillus sp.]MCL6517651.1 endospore germination permease [Alicyclobacillus sp.]